jgi:hypothetical protein
MASPSSSHGGESKYLHRLISALDDASTPASTMGTTVVTRMDEDRRRTDPRIPARQLAFELHRSHCSGTVWARMPKSGLVYRRPLRTQIRRRHCGN